MLSQFKSFLISRFFLYAKILKFHTHETLNGIKSFCVYEWQLKIKKKWICVCNKENVIKILHSYFIGTHTHTLYFLPTIINAVYIFGSIKINVILIHACSKRRERNYAAFLSNLIKFDSWSICSIAFQ